MPDPKVIIELTTEEALVLHDWLARFNKTGKPEFEDQAEQRVLWDVESTLESALHQLFDLEYEALISAARSRLRDLED